MTNNLQYQAIQAKLKELQEALANLLVQLEELNRKTKDSSKNKDV